MGKTIFVMAGNDQVAACPDYPGRKNRSEEIFCYRCRTAGPFPGALDFFYINLALGAVSLVCMFLFFKEFREKPEKVSLDWTGIFLLSGLILGILSLVSPGLALCLPSRPLKSKVKASM